MRVWWFSQVPNLIDLPKVERLGTLGARPIQKKNGEESCGKPVDQDIPGGLARSNLGMSWPNWSNFLKSLRGQKAILRYQHGVCDEGEYDLVPHADKGSA